MRFTATIELGGKTATGIPVPEEVVLGVGRGKRVPVVVSLGGHSYRSTIAAYNGIYMLPLAAEHREAAGVAAGQAVEVDVVVDDDRWTPIGARSSVGPGGVEMRTRKHVVPWVVSSVLATAVALSGCSSPQQAAPEALEGTWVLQSFGAVNGLTATDTRTTTEMTLAGGEATGNGGVNSFTSTYQAPEAGRVSFGPIASTRMAGPAVAMAQEAAFFAALESTTGFEITEEKLVLSDMGNNTVAILIPGPASTPSTGLPAPIIVEPGQGAAEASVGDTIVFNQPDPANTTISTNNPDVLDLVQGSDDGSAQFNPAATARAPGVAVVTIKASDGSSSEVTVTVR